MKPSLTLTGPDQAFYMPFGLNELPQPQLASAFGFCTTCAADCSISTGLYMPRRSTRHTHQHGVLGKTQIRFACRRLRRSLRQG